MSEINDRMNEDIKETISKLNNPSAVMLGSNMYIGEDGLMRFESNGEYKDFFRIREIYHVRKKGSHLAVDVDIKNETGKREIKIAKSRPVVTPKNVTASSEKTFTEARRNDGTLIIKIEQIEPDDPTLPKDGPVRGALDSGELYTIVRITGNFYIGSNKLNITNDELEVNNGSKLRGNLKITKKGDFLILHKDGGLSF